MIDRNRGVNLPGAATTSRLAAPAEPTPAPYVFVVPRTLAGQREGLRTARAAGG